MTAPRDPYTLDQAAALVGLSGERFRKVWRWWVRVRAYPHPLKYPELVDGRMSRTPYAWDADACDAWRATASDAARHPAPSRPHTAAGVFAANDRHPLDAPASARSPALNRRLAAQRAELSTFLKGAHQ